MHSSYDDITSRIKDPVLWWDNGGVPRYDKFHPDACPCIYSRTVVLLRIMCQSCHEQFDVEMHSDVFNRMGPPKNLHYGDPPRHKCRGAGEVENCIDIAVLEVWTKGDSYEWGRHPELEGLIDQDDDGGAFQYHATKFSELSKQWKEETKHLSSAEQKAMHLAYQRIIGMGHMSLRHIFADLANTHDHWFWALSAITGENPVPLEDAGNIDAMVKAWLEWGKKHQYWEE